MKPRLPVAGLPGSRHAADPPVLVIESTSLPAEEALNSDNVFAVLDFLEDPLDARTCDPRHVVTGLPCLCPRGSREIWRTLSPVTTGWNDTVSWASGEFGLFAASTVPAPPKQDVAEIARKAWSELLKTAVEMGYPHVFRAWNHLPLINVGDGDDERYKRFCMGRYQAFEGHGYSESQFPAATAVGNFGEALVVYLLAGTEPGRHFENPRQVRAPLYPRRYGPRPPSFARATSRADSKLVFVAGTASIVGHRSRHADDLTGQLAVTFDNIDRLLEVTLGPSGTRGGLESVRVYLRRPEQLERARMAVEDRMPLAKAVYLHAEICRSELDVEIEGVCRL